MTDDAVIPCPCEEKDPPEGPGKVPDDEPLFYVVKYEEGLTWDGGIPKLSFLALRNEDIEAKQQGKTVSCMRPNHMKLETMTERARLICANGSWADNPVVGKVRAGALRAIKSAVGWREVCVFADPTDETDSAGACPEHASIKRSQVNPKTRAKPPAPALDKHKRRSAIAEAFSEVFHLATGAPPTQPEQAAS